MGGAIVGPETDMDLMQGFCLPGRGQVSKNRAGRPADRVAGWYPSLRSKSHEQLEHFAEGAQEIIYKVRRKFVCTSHCSSNVIVVSAPRLSFFYFIFIF